MRSCVAQFIYLYYHRAKLAASAALLAITTFTSVHRFAYGPGVAQLFRVCYYPGTICSQSLLAVRQTKPAV